MITCSKWNNILTTEKEKPYFNHLLVKLDDLYNSHTIYPPKSQIFSALNLTPFDDVKVVILGQDPYHGENQAHGLAFSVKNDVKIPPSLRNIFKEYVNDLDLTFPTTTNLSAWAKNGVLLLNTTLTVEASKPLSHANLGWETFTDQLLMELNHQKDHIVFILWGSHAQKKAKFIDGNKHLVIKSPHPSPLSAYRGFFGSNPFTKTNEYLIASNQKPINWKL